MGLVNVLTQNVGLPGRLVDEAGGAGALPWSMEVGAIRAG